MKAQEILNAAAGHMQDRANTYDKPEGERSMGATVAAFYAITGHALTDEQGWLFMALLKMVRSQQGEFRSDSYEDGAAYFALAGEAAHADRKPTVQWQEVRDAARMVAEMESAPVENSEIPNFPTIDSGPMWIEWRGESEVPPVAEGAMVEVRSRDGETEIGLAGYFEWMHGVLSYDHDIVAWREPWPGDERIDAIGQNGEADGQPSSSVDSCGMFDFLVDQPPHSIRLT